MSDWKEIAQFAQEIAREAGHLIRQERDQQTVDPEQHLSLFSQQLLIGQDRCLSEAGMLAPRFPVRGMKGLVTQLQ